MESSSETEAFQKKPTLCEPAQPYILESSPAVLSRSMRVKPRRPRLVPPPLKRGTPRKRAHLSRRTLSRRARARGGQIALTRAARSREDAPRPVAGRVPPKAIRERKHRALSLPKGSALGCSWTASGPRALSGHHALQHVEGRLVCLVGETRGQRALQRGDAASVRGHLRC